MDNELRHALKQAVYLLIRDFFFYSELLDIKEVLEDIIADKKDSGYTDT